MLTIRLESSHIDFKNKYDYLLSTYTIETINFKRNLIKPLDKDKIVGGVYDHDKLIFMFCNALPYELQVFSEVNDTELIKEGLKLLINYILENKIQIKGIAANKLITTIAKEVFNNHAIELNLVLASDIMKLTNLSYQSNTEFIKLDMEFYDQLFIMCKAFIHEALHEEPLDEVVNKLITSFIHDEVIYGIFNEKEILVSCVVARKIENFYNLSFVYTKKEYRGKGYAKKLLSKVIEKLLNEVTMISLFVDKINPISNKVYLDIGFNYLIDSYAYQIK